MKYISTIAMFALTILLVACTSSNESNIPNEPVKTEVPSDNSDLRIEASPDGVKVNIPESDTENNWESELMNFFNSKNNLQWKIDYDITGTADGVSTTMKVSEYFKGNMIRTDMTVMGLESRNFIINEEYTTCTKMKAEWNCNKITAADEKTQTFENNDISEDYVREPTKYKTEYAGTKVVAGETTKCYKVTDSEDISIVTYCYNNDAIPLYVKSESSDSSSEMIATSFSRTVSNSDFELPEGAKVTEGSSIDIGSDPCAGCSYLPEDMQADCLSSCQ